MLQLRPATSEQSPLDTSEGLSPFPGQLTLWEQENGTPESTLDVLAIVCELLGTDLSEHDS